MKQKILLAVAVIITCSFMVEPFAYFFSTVDPATGRSGTKPEKTTAVYSKPKGKSATIDYTIAGTKSPIRLKIAEAVFNAYPDEASATLDPSLYIGLYKISSDRKNRILSMTAEGGGASWLPITISRPDGYTIRVTPGVAMQPGEYALVDRTTTTAEGNITVWTFGID